METQKYQIIRDDKHKIEYLQWANKEPNPITNDTYLEYIAVAQLINYRFKNIFLQQ